MESIEALSAFAALSQETRLKAFRILVEHGKKGIASGDLSKKLKIPANTLSFHLAHLRQAQLVISRKKSRSVIYYANIAVMQELIEFMFEDCCAVDNDVCIDIEKIFKKAKKASKKKKCC